MRKVVLGLAMKMCLRVFAKIAFYKGVESET